MLIYVIRRLLITIPILLAASVFVFLLATLTGNPLEPLLLQNPRPPQSTIDLEAHRLFLDRSFPERYWIWLTGFGADGCGWSPWFADSCNSGLLRGEFGPSVSAPRDIGEEVGSRFLTTVRLVTAALVSAISLAVVIGVLSAVRQYSKLDHGLTFVMFLALSMPLFWFAHLVKAAAIEVNNAVGDTLFFTIGATSSDTRGFTIWESLSDILGHLVLPTFALMLVTLAALARFQRASMLEVLSSDYVRLARAKGLRNRVVLRRHALRNALIPLATVSMVTIAGTIDGVVLTETVFQWRGLGTFFVASVQQDDVNAVMAFVMISGFIVIIFNLIADLLYAVLDPRIRYD